MRNLYAAAVFVAFCLTGCVESPYAVSKGSFKLKINDPIVECTIVEEGIRKRVKRICFWHEDYDKKEYKTRKYSSSEGGVHIWVRTYSDATEKMTAFRGAIDLTQVQNLKVVKKCGSKLYAPDNMPGKRFMWLLVTDKKGEEKEYLAPADTIVWFREMHDAPGSIALIEVEEITDIRRVEDIEMR